jgi:hypothetical protein
MRQLFVPISKEVLKLAPAETKILKTDALDSRKPVSISFDITSLAPLRNVGGVEEHKDTITQELVAGLNQHALFFTNEIEKSSSILQNSSRTK